MHQLQAGVSPVTIKDILGHALGGTASDGLGIRTLPAEMSNDPAGVEEIGEGAGIHSCTGARW